MDDMETARAMRSLTSQVATPPYLTLEARELKERGLMTFVEWPAGLWRITERGRGFLSHAADEPEC